MGCSRSSPRNEAALGGLGPEAADPETHPIRKALAQLKVLFDGIDVNADSSVSADELAAALTKNPHLVNLAREAGLDMREKGFGQGQFKKVFEQLDINGNGRITWEEFKASLFPTAVEQVTSSGEVLAAQAPAQEKALAQLKTLFDAMDVNNNSTVSREELEGQLGRDESFRSLIRDAGMDPDFHVFEQLDTNADGSVTWEEFRLHLYKSAVKEVNTKGALGATPREFACAIEAEGSSKWTCC